MALTQEQFEQLVRQLEQKTKENPKNFQHKVWKLAIFGYSYILLMLLLTAGLIVFIAVKEPGGNNLFSGILVSSLLVTSLILFGMILRSLWVWVPKPKGKKLRRKNAPQLFQFIDELSKTFHTPKFHNIILIDELNAAVYQRPRLGIFGWFQNYLLIGLPLLQALSIEQFQAVIAHEMGHLSDQHSRFANWIYSVRLVWVQLLTNINKIYHGSGSRTGFWGLDILILISTGISYLMFGWVFERFVNQFTAHAFVLSRLNEHEADRFSASWSNGQHLAEGLISLSVKERYLQQLFWPSIYDGIHDKSKEPPDAIVLRSNALRSPLPSERQSQWLNAALSEHTTTEDTHPCLSERLLALGYLSEAMNLLPNLVLTTSALNTLFSEAERHHLMNQWNQDWRQKNQGYWEMWTKYLKEAKSKLQDLEQKKAIKSLSFDEKWKYCKWVKHLRGDDAALPLLHDLLAEKSFFAPANMLLGEILLRKQNNQGIDYLENAVSCDHELSIPAYETIRQYIYCELGDTQKLQVYDQNIEQYYLRRAYAPIILE